ncbi:glycosyltransferase family 2 protein [Nocardioides sp. zg-1228]|uniref:glycosyltransferase family 2 protein n=1 Tax=Nocardioides sp. zg-1228 TaxID=2763008 RepID=UPI0016431A7C|nr:glycosyltransferase family 2 protein [Nocardioides sp. zg-1228]MBC2931988.1 glycosyltransferase [Nocardioides sp. zg-1228]QSF57543.1 glycosyltransferase [Nocardioides sp. zg-1228]
MARQPVVRHNDWGSLTPATLGDWEPTLSVSVVVPTFNYQRTLPYVLAALAAQSYPDHLLEVLVVDDQSSPPQELPEVRPERTRLIRVEEGWGRANACHLGALAAEGDVLHWYDADMLAHREEVEAHARWHHLVDYAVPGGHKLFVDPASLFDLDPAVVRDRVAAGGAGELFPDQEHEPHQWVEDYWAKTGDLRTAGPRAQRYHIGMTGSVSKALYLDSAGFDRTLRLGEDMHLGHSLAQAGGVFVVDRQARSWHLGRSQVLRRAEQVNRFNDPYLADLVPTMRPKRNRRGRAYQVPYLEVVLEAGPADETIHLVDSLLDGDVPDLRITLVGPWGSVHDERVQPVEDPVLETRLVHRSYLHEPRVRLVEQRPTGSDAEFVLTLPDVSHAPLPATLSALLDDLERTHHGARVLAYDTGAAARLERTSALARVARLVDEGDDAEALLDESFGVKTYPATSVGWVPVADRVVERFVLGARPPMDPDKSEHRLRKALRRAADASAAAGQDGPGRPAEPAPGETPDAEADHHRRGIFGRRR